DSADEQKSRATDEAGQLGTGPGQVAAVSGLAAICAAAAVLIAVAAAGIGVVTDRELAGQFGVTAGDGDVVVADVGRGIRGCAVDVDGGLALVVGVDGVLVGGDVRIALGVDHELDVFAGLAVLDGEGAALDVIDEVGRSGRLRRDGQPGPGGRGRGLLGLFFAARDRHRLRIRLGLLVGAQDVVFAGFERRFALDRAAD